MFRTHRCVSRTGATIILRPEYQGLSLIQIAIRVGNVSDNISSAGAQRFKLKAARDKPAGRPGWPGVFILVEILRPRAYTPHVFPSPPNDGLRI